MSPSPQGSAAHCSRVKRAPEIAEHFTAIYYFQAKTFHLQFLTVDFRLLVASTAARLFMLSLPFRVTIKFKLAIFQYYECVSTKIKD